MTLCFDYSTAHRGMFAQNDVMRYMSCFSPLLLALCIAADFHSNLKKLLVEIIAKHM